jgi:hypothetical protein
MNGHGLTSEEALAYAAGDLEGAERTRVEAALRSSPDLAALVERYRAVRSALERDRVDAPREALTAQLRSIYRPPARAAEAGGGLAGAVQRIVASLVFDSRTASAATGVRGVGDACELSYEAGRVHVDLRLDAVGSGDDAAWRLIGQIEDDDGSDRASPVMVRLVDEDGGRITAGVQSDEHGMFVLETTSGRYRLEVERRKDIILVPGIEVA